MPVGISLYPLLHCFLVIIYRAVDQRIYRYRGIWYHSLQTQFMVCSFIYWV